MTKRKTIKPVKAIKAWAMVLNGKINPDNCYRSRSVAESCCDWYFYGLGDTSAKVIPVLITPLKKK